MSDERKSLVSNGHGFELVKLGLNLVGLALIGVVSCSVTRLADEVRQNAIRSHGNERVLERNTEQINGARRDIQRIEESDRRQWEVIQQLNRRNGMK